MFGFGEEGRKRVVEFALDGGGWRLLIDDAGNEGFVGSSKRLKGGENVGIRSGGLRSAKFGDGESHSGEKAAVCVDQFRGNAHVKKRSIGGESAGMLTLVTVGGEEITAVGGAVDGEFSLGATTDGADFFSFGGAKAAWLAFLANWTSHVRSPGKPFPQG